MGISWFMVRYVVGWFGLVGFWLGVVLLHEYTKTHSDHHCIKPAKVEMERP